MTISPPDVLLGAQTPRILHLPPDIRSTSGPEFIQLAEDAGLYLDPWQQYDVNIATSERTGGDWAATEFVEVAPRQNGKGGVIECLQLGFLYLLKLPLILHTAHLFPTSEEAFRRMMARIEGCDDLTRKTMKPKVSNGKEGFQLTPSAGSGRLRYVARSKDSGRGFSVPALFFDEAFALAAAQMSAILPTMSGQPNPWVGYFSSAPVPTSAQLHRFRARALAGDAGRLAYAEYSVDPDVYGGQDSDAWAVARRDPRVWAMANPAMGIRIRAEAIQTELDSLAPADFDRERLGVPDPPVGEVDPPFPLDVWDNCSADADRPEGGLVWAVDVSPDQVSAAVAVAWRRDDGRVQVQVVDHRPGVGWLAARAAALRAEHGGVWLVDLRGASGSQAAGWEGVSVTPTQAKQGCAELEAAVRGGGLAHFAQPELRLALGGAVRRPSEDGGWSWSRRSTAVDISPLVAVTLAHSGVLSGVGEVVAGDALLSLW